MVYTRVPPLIRKVRDSFASTSPLANGSINIIPAQVPMFIPDENCLFMVQINGCDKHSIDI